MKIINNVVTPEEGNKLMINSYDELYDELCLGQSNYFINDKIVLLNLTANDVYEVTNIDIDGVTYSVKLCKEYSQLVNNLIRLKYSLDLELALHANLFVVKNGRLQQSNSHVDLFIEFENWRTTCKSIAKDLLNE